MGTVFSPSAPRLRDSTAYKVLKCAGCGHQQLSPLPLPSEDDEFYDADRQQANIGQTVDLNTIDALLADDTERRIRLICERAAKGRLLDVGSGYGLFLKRALDHGFAAAGIEVSSDRIDFARQLTAGPIHRVDIRNHDGSLGRFEAVTAFHVLEHVIEPIPFLSALQQLLAPGGSLFVEVPSAADMMLEASTPYREFWWQRAHVSYFTPDSLRAVLSRAGYANVEILGVQRYGIENMMHWLEHGKPQLDAPSYHTTGPYRWLEIQYKETLERRLRSDTVIAIARR